MRRRSLLFFILLNVVVTFLVTVITLTIYSRIAPTATPRFAQMPPIIVTATNDPNITPRVIIVTATPGPTQLSLVPSPATSSSANLTPGIQTLDPGLLPTSLAAITANAADLSASATPASLGTDVNGCQTYTLKAGDTAGSIANSFGISLTDLMQANNLTNRDLTRLQIGQTLTIPINGCGLASPTPTDTPTNFQIPTISSTTTLAPTAAQSTVEIVRVISPGDITAEGIELHNTSGGLIEMQGWTLSNSKGVAYTFPNYRMFKEGRVTIYTRTGKDTPAVLYWNQPRALWSNTNEVITLKDAKGAVQATMQVGASATAASP